MDSPNQPSSPVQSVSQPNPSSSQLTGISEPVKLSRWQQVKNFLHYLFGEGHVILLFAAFGILLLKFGNYFVNLITLKSKAEMKSADAEDVVLKTQADTDTKQADALVQQSQQLPSQEGQVDENWNKEK
jgi:hypothetical protein